MKLTSKALEAIKNYKIRAKLAASLGHTDQWIVKLISQNKENGTLTTFKALEIIKKETGLKQSEILTEGIEVG